MAQAPTELLLLLGPGAHEILCVSFKSEVCISSSPLEFSKLSLAGLQSQMLLRFIFPIQDPQAEELRLWPDSIGESRGSLCRGGRGSGLGFRKILLTVRTVDQK